MATLISPAYIAIGSAFSAGTLTELSGNGYARQSTTLTYDPVTGVIAFTGGTFIASGTYTAGTNIAIFDASSGGNMLFTWAQATAAIASGASITVPANSIALTTPFPVSATAVAPRTIFGTITTAPGMTVNVQTGNTGLTYSSAGLLTAANALLTLTDAATITWDASKSSYATVTLGATGRTLAISNAVAGQALYLKVVQDGTGSRTITTYTNVLWAASTAPTLTTTASAFDVLRFTYDAVAGKFWAETVGKAFG